jgi:hypothetical protein
MRARYACATLLGMLGTLLLTAPVRAAPTVSTPEPDHAPHAAAPAPPAPPAAPGGAAATALSVSQIRLSWVDNANSETGYRVTDGGSTWTMGANTTSFTLSGLAAGTYRCFRVQAYNNVGRSAWAPPAPANWACATTPVASAPPAAPGGATATALSVSQIRLSWVDNANSETGYRVTDGGSTWTMGANTTSFTLSGLAPGTYRCFRVQAYNNVGRSAWAPPAPANWTCATTRRQAASAAAR